MSSILDKFKSKEGIVEAIEEYDKPLELLFEEISSILDDPSNKHIVVSAKHLGQKENEAIIIAEAKTGLRYGALRVVFTKRSADHKFGKFTTWNVELIPISGIFTEKRISDRLQELSEEFTGY